VLERPNVRSKGNASDLYLEGVRFEFRLTHHLPYSFGGLCLFLVKLAGSYFFAGQNMDRHIGLSCEISEVQEGKSLNCIILDYDTVQFPTWLPQLRRATCYRHVQGTFDY
jgi:hypothetical protein